MESSYTKADRHAVAKVLRAQRDARLANIERDRGEFELYLIDLNGKQYVGQATQWYVRKKTGMGQWSSSEDRVVQHLDDALKSNGGTCRYLNAALRKHGLSTLRLTILAHSVPADKINELEVDTIREMQTLAPRGYNLQEGGHRGRAHPETRKLMSEQRQGALHPMYGKQHSNATKVALIEAGLKVGMDKDGVTPLPLGIKFNKASNTYRENYQATAYCIEGDNVKRYIRRFSSANVSLAQKSAAIEWKMHVEAGQPALNGRGQPITHREARVRDWSTQKRNRAKRTGVEIEVRENIF